MWYIILLLPDATGTIDVAKALDYESTALRVTDLVVQASDGFCTSPKYQLHLQVTHECVELKGWRIWLKLLT